MARTILEIYNSIIAEKQTLSSLNNLQPNIDSGQQLLNDLTSPSNVAVWRLIFFVIAVAIWSLENLFDIHVKWIENRASELVVGSEKWYELKAREFQIGDDLEFDGITYKYPVINESNKIVKVVAAKQSAGAVLIKVAKLDGLDPIPLTTEELDAFTAYMNKIKFAGIKTPCLSREADELSIEYRVYYNPLVLNSDGELLTDTSIKPVEEAINNYCKNLPFNGLFSVTDLTDKIQKSTGVVNPVYLSGQVRYGLLPWVNLQDYYNPNAGYLTATMSIEYIPQ